ncbi:hypothetical protein I7I53_06167 [Histoplasma capsulatum var. duboisii H88]|uniref:Uncharacterized protein n=1 Tax=Ajellomyces capsulatus (strain H88) TaxID=544711 RepID=A0A8A1LAH8_AJEC8|nr:hypothetical protein I7I53_06167 [Histoplasma capsulatum var. duboisii H88]
MHPIDGPVDEGYLVRDKKPDLGQQYQKERKWKGKGTPHWTSNKKFPVPDPQLLVSADGVA